MSVQAPTTAPNNMLYRGSNIRPILNGVGTTSKMPETTRTVLPSALQLLMQANPNLTEEQAATFYTMAESFRGGR